MALSLNRSLYLILLVLFSFLGNAQEDEDYDQFQERRDSEKDFQNQKDFKKYHRRAVQISAWQIQNLKFGAIVVRLQNNRRKIDAYRKIGNEKAALETIAKTEYNNRNIIRAYTAYYDFSKIYFIYAQNSDSLLKGVKKGIFIDSTLKMNPSITMSEDFYLIVEKDYLYNSTIGFVPEDSAKFVSEHGRKTIEYDIMVKNKYGHQLKSPFPTNPTRARFFKSEWTKVKWPVEVSDGIYKNITIEVNNSTVKYWSNSVESINLEFHNFYQRYAGLQLKDPKLKPFLY